MQVNLVTVLKWFWIYILWNYKNKYGEKQNTFIIVFPKMPFDCNFFLKIQWNNEKYLFIYMVVFVETGLRGVKRELLVALTKCQRVKACQEVLEEYEIGKLDVNGIDYDQVIIHWKHFINSNSTYL